MSLIRGLEADKSIGLLFFINWEHFDALNLSVLSLEEFFHLLFCHLGVEVLDVQVASLLGVLVLDGLAEEFSLTVRSTESGLDVESLAVSHVLSV